MALVAARCWLIARSVDPIKSQNLYPAHLLLSMLGMDHMLGKTATKADVIGFGRNALGHYPYVRAHGHDMTSCSVCPHGGGALGGGRAV